MARHGGIDWRRTSRWCALGAVVMVLWLLAPVARCSYAAFRDAPIGEVTDEDAPEQADRARVVEGTGFFGRTRDAVVACYRLTPPLSQEAWKRNVLYALLALGALARGIAWYQVRRRRTFADG